jgi:hypothetical protein
VLANEIAGADEAERAIELPPPQSGQSPRQLAIGLGFGMHEPQESCVANGRPVSEESILHLTAVRMEIERR